MKDKAFIIPENAELRNMTSEKKAELFDDILNKLKSPESRSTEEITEEVGGKYNSEQEGIISDNIEAYGRSREEVAPIRPRAAARSRSSSDPG